MRRPPHAAGSQDVEANDGVVVFSELMVVPQRRVSRSMAEQNMAAPEKWNGSIFLLLHMAIAEYYIQVGKLDERQEGLTFKVVIFTF